MLSLENVSKRFGTATAIESSSVTFPQGVTLVAGPNGSGKSTILAMCAGALTPDTGHVRYGAYDSELDRVAFRRQIAYVPSQCEFYSFLTVEELVKLILGAHGQSAAEAHQALQELGIDNMVKKRLGSLSFGTRRKAFLACAFTLKASVVILDEPCVGLDKSSLDVLATWIERDARTIVIASHDQEFLSRIEHQTLLIQGSVLGQSVATP
ncbi:MAG: ABC transporter ATP-binding protein [Burkholderiales bacterium]|nr:ABC transporter ATP-binding protein [Burkholderiales bacterium]